MPSYKVVDNFFLETKYSIDLLIACIILIIHTWNEKKKNYTELTSMHNASSFVS